MKHLAFDNMKKNPAVNPFASAVKPKGLRGHFVREGKVIKQARKLQEPQADKLTRQEAYKLTNLQANKLTDDKIAS